MNAERLELLLNDATSGTLVTNEPMSRHTTLRVGGPARWFWAATDLERLVHVLDICWQNDIPYLFVGHGSNLLMSDKGYNGLIIQNRCKHIDLPPPDQHMPITAQSGASLGSLFLRAARAGYGGLEWGVGIPGTVGGALVSNAGAYRGNIGPLVSSVRVFAGGQDQTVEPSWMEFSYRDSKLRRAGIGRTVILSCELKLPYEGDPDGIIQRASVYQEQRKSKQPFDPSAGSFFKNVLDKSLAQSLPRLTQGMKDAGVVPAGFLIEACGLKGARVGGAGVSEKHANFFVNASRAATATELRQLADFVKSKVREQFGVTLEEEVLYVGDWG